ncbi:MAG TPA: type VI secretion system baseplate subunit TssK [Bryobacteraceae bacterium]|nr:type VI secretion system baseplate subunit TssK [Bryobacteraceae bacterium]
MRSLCRVVWSEGMHLGPHHFQAQSAYFEDSLQFVAMALWAEPWGLLAWRLDAEALRNGIVAVAEARGVFADGLPFQMPEVDPLPEPRQIAPLFPPVADAVIVSLAVPKKGRGPRTALEAAGANGYARYTAEERTVRDENSGRDEQPVRLGRKNIRLVLDSELDDALETLPVARVTRSASGGFEYDPAFIPPCLQFSASPRLMEISGRLIEIMQAKAAALSRVGRGAATGATGLSAQQVSAFWFLHAINEGLAPLRHHFYAKHGHPEELYVDLLRLAGALCTFGLNSDPSRLPAYKHLNLTQCFAELDSHIREHLELVAPTGAVEIPLQPTGHYLWAGRVSDPRALGAARWILGMRARMGEADLIASVPQLVKICSRAFVPELVKRALPGMSLTHLPVPPAQLAPKVDYQYFLISRGGPCWEHLMQTKEVGVYVPGEIRDPEFELMVVVE